MHLYNIEAGNVFGLCHVFKVCMGAYYLGGFIGYGEFKSDWLEECTETWERNIHTISKTAGGNPQESDAVVVCVIQSERIFLQHGTKNTGDAFSGVEKMLWETFLPRLFFAKSKYLSPIVGTLSKMPVKKSGLGLLNPLTSANEKYLISQRASTELIRYLTGEGKLSNSDHPWCSGKKGMTDRKAVITPTTPNSST